MDAPLVPQFLFSHLIRKVHNLEGEEQSPFYQFTQEDVSKETEILAHILSELPQERGILVAWFVVEEPFKKNQLFQIESELLNLINKTLPNHWDVQIQWIPGDATCTVNDLMSAVEEEVHKLSVQFPFERFGQIVGFGHPSPFQALFLQGIQQFENRYASIYLKENEVSVISTSFKHPIKRWEKQFRDFILDHDYIAALEILSDIKETSQVLGIRHLLQSMVDRFNFSFEDSLAHLQDAEQILGESVLLNETKDHLDQLNSTDSKIRDLARIQELFRQIDVFVQTDDTTSFLVRFYRVREAIAYYLMEHAQTNPVKQKHTHKGSIYDLFEQLEERYASWEVDGYYGAYFYIKSANVAAVLDARNKSFLGHSRKPINRFNVWRSYFGTHRVSVGQAKKRFMMDTSIMLRDLGVLEDENIHQLNRYVLDLSSKLQSQVTINA